MPVFIALALAVAAAFVFSALLRGG